jgi:hypothetical protein
MKHINENVFNDLYDTFNNPWIIDMIMTDKPCGGPLCNVKKADDVVDIGQISKKENRRKVYSILAFVAVAIIGIVFLFYPPGGAPIIGEPIDPVSGSFAIIIGALLGASVVIFFGIIVVVQRKKSKK